MPSYTSIRPTRGCPKPLLISEPRPGNQALLWEWIKAEARKLEHQYPHALKVRYRGSQITLNPCSNFLGFTIGVFVILGLGRLGSSRRALLLRRAGSFLRACLCFGLPRNQCASYYWDVRHLEVWGCTEFRPLAVRAAITKTFNIDDMSSSSGRASGSSLRSRRPQRKP